MNIFYKKKSYNFKLFGKYSKKTEKIIEKFTNGRRKIFNNIEWNKDINAPKIYSKQIKKYTENYLKEINKSKDLTDNIKDEFILFIKNTDPITYKELRGKSIKKFLYRKFN